MPTPTFLTGGEHGVMITGATPVPNDRIWHTVTTTGGTPAIVSTGAIKNGARVMRFPASAGACWVGRTVSGSPGECVASFYMMFEGSLPDADCKIFSFSPAAGSLCDVRYQTATTDIRARVGSTNGSSGVTVVADTWYLIDCVCDVNSGTRTMDVQVNGVACGQASAAVAASTVSTFRVGANTDTTTATATVRIDDLVISSTLGDYPMGEHQVLVMRPNADGTHSFTAGDFGYDDAGGNVATSATDVWSFLDDTTIETIGTTDSIRQKVVRSTGYVEIGFEAAPATGDAWGVQVQSVYDASATGANTCWLKWNDGGTILDVYSNAPTGADFSNTSATFNSTQRATAPSGGAWTQAKLDAVKLRWGYATDVVGVPIIHGLMLEVAYPLAPSFTGSGSLTANATISAVGILAFIGSAALGVAQPGVSGTGALIENVTGSAALSVPAPGVASSGLLTFTGTGALLVTPPAVAGSGETVFNVTGTASLAIPPPSIAGSGEVTQASVTGSGALSVPTPSVSASGLETFTGTSALTVTAPSLAATGTFSFDGTASLSALATISGAGLEAFLGSASLTVPAPSIAGYETVGAAGPIAVHELTLALRTQHNLTVAIRRWQGNSIMDTYTTANANQDTSMTTFSTASAPMV